MIATAERSDCALCGAPGDPLYAETRDRLFSAPGSWGHLRCPTCGLVWLNPQPLPREVGKLYESYFTHESRGVDSSFKRAVKRGIPAALFGYADVVQDRSELALGRALAHVGPLREVAEQAIMSLPASRRGRLLDVGCGAGEFLRHMQDLGWRVSGAEPDPQARDRARSALGTQEIYSDVVAEELPPDHFDAVTLNHVIEHLLDPAETLRACHRLLAPGGLLVLATPNTQSLGHRHFASDWLHLDPPRHLHLFDPATLSRLVESAGFRVNRVATPCATAHFVWLASSLLRSRGRLPGVDVSGASRSNALVGLAFWAWEYLRARLGQPCGEEVLLIAEKPARAVPAPERQP